MLKMPPNIKDFHFPSGEGIDPKRMSESCCVTDNGMGCVRAR